jgi:hypothetical protein
MTAQMWDDEFDDADPNDILAELQRRHDADMAALDRQDAATARQARVEADESDAIGMDADEDAVMEALTAAGLARDGFDPGGDWRQVLAQRGLDEYGNPSDGRTAVPRPRALPPVAAGV